MGYTHSHNIERAATYLLTVLRDKNPIKYSVFYDGTSETEERLIAAISEEDYPLDSAAYVFDLAASQLCDQGIVSLRILDSRLADGEPDYEIELTTEGAKYLASGKTLRFHDAE